MPLFGSSKKADAKAKATAKSKGKGAPTPSAKGPQVYQNKGAPSTSKGAPPHGAKGSGKGVPVQPPPAPPQAQSRAALQSQVEQVHESLEVVKQILAQPFDAGMTDVLDSMMGEAGAHLQALQDKMLQSGVEDPGFINVASEFLELQPRADEWKLGGGPHARTDSRGGSQSRSDSRTRSSDGEEEEEEEESEDEAMRQAMEESRRHAEAEEAARRAEEDTIRKLAEDSQRHKAAEEEAAAKKAAEEAHQREQEQEEHARRLEAEAEKAKRAAAAAAEAAAREHDERKRREDLAEQHRQEQIQKQKEQEEKAAEEAAAAWHAEQLRLQQEAANKAHEEQVRRGRHDEEDMLREQMAVVQQIKLEEQEAKKLQEEADEAKRKAEAAKKAAKAERDEKKRQEDLAEQRRQEEIAQKNAEAAEAKAHHAREEAAKRAVEEEEHARQLERKAREAEQRAEKAFRSAESETDEIKRNNSRAEQFRQMEDAKRLHGQASEEMAHARMLHELEKGSRSDSRESKEARKAEAEAMLRETLQAASADAFELVEFAVNEAKEAGVSNKRLLQDGERKLAQMKKGHFLKKLEEDFKNPQINPVKMEEDLRKASEAGLSPAELAPFKKRLKTVADQEKCKYELVEAIHSADPGRLKRAISDARKAGVENDAVHAGEVSLKACQFLMGRGDLKKPALHAWREVHAENKRIKQQLKDVETNGADASEIEGVVAKALDLEIVDSHTSHNLLNLAQTRRLAHDQAVCAVVSKEYFDLKAAMQVLEQAGGPKTTIDILRPEVQAAEEDEKTLLRLDEILPSAVSKFQEARRAAVVDSQSASAIDFSAVGEYVVTLSGLPVSTTFERNSQQVTTLDAGAKVIVLEFATKIADGRVRARIESPAGWISTWMANDKDTAFVTRQAHLAIPHGEDLTSVAKVPPSNAPRAVTASPSPLAQKNFVASSSSPPIIADMNVAQKDQTASTSWFGSGSLLGELMGFGSADNQLPAKAGSQHEGPLSGGAPKTPSRLPLVDHKQKHQEMKSKVERARLWIHEQDRAHKKAQRAASPPLHPHQHPGKLQGSPPSSGHSMFSPFGSHSSQGTVNGYGAYPPQGPAAQYAGMMTGAPPPYHMGGITAGPYGYPGMR